MTFISRGLAAMSFAALGALSACGGGGDDVDVPVQEVLAAYAGRWQAPCTVDGGGAYLVSDPPDSASLSIGSIFELQVAGDRLVGTRIDRLYDDNDCRSNPIATHVSPISATYDGEVSVSANGAMRLALKTTFALGATLPGMSGQQITVNNIVYQNQDGTWTGVRSVKSLMLVAGGRLYLGDDEPLDGQGYPTVITLDPDEAWIRF